MVHIHHFKTHNFLHTKQSRIKTKMPLHDKKMLAFVVIGIMISIPLVTINLATIHQFAGIGVDSTTRFQKSSSAVDIPLMTKDDLIYQTRSAFVIPEYKLIFFTFPKVACSEWKRMFMRINGNPNWCKIHGFNAVSISFSMSYVYERICYCTVCTHSIILCSNVCILLASLQIPFNIICHLSSIAWSTKE